MLEKHFVIFFILVLYKCSFGQEKCGWPDEMGVCTHVKSCAKNDLLNVNFIPPNSPNRHKTPMRCERLNDVCCQESQPNLYCRINEREGKCVTTNLCKNELKANHGEGKIEVRSANKLCKPDFVCCDDEMIHCEVDDKAGYCKVDCDQELILSSNHGEKIFEPRRIPVCKSPSVCCAINTVKRIDLCSGYCAKTCDNPLDIDVRINLGESLNEDRRTPAKGQQCATNEICCREEEQTVDYNKCGRFYEPLHDRIVGGINSEFAEYPWLVQIARQTIIHKQRAIVYICAGALIHPKIVLTTAHCVHEQNINSLFVCAGVYDVHENDEEFPHQNRKVSKIISHESFDFENHIDNTALLILEEEFELDKHIGTICLARQYSEHDLDEKCVLTGWGKTGLDIASNYSEIPKLVNLNIISSDECQAKLRRTKLGADFMLDSGFICAFGDSKEDACKGDGGSPLVCPIPGQPERYYQAGIVSWGIGCGENPGIYVNTAKYRDWIDEQLQNVMEIDTNTYSF